MGTTLPRRVCAVLRSFILGCLLPIAVPQIAAAAEIRQAAEPVPGRYIVTVSMLTTDVSAVAGDLASKYDGRVLAVWKHALKGFWIEMSPASASRLASDRRVVAIEQDAALHSSSSGSRTTSTGPGPRTGHPLWHLTRINRRSPVASAEDPSPYFKYDYRNDGSWGTGANDRVFVYVVDSGVWKGHSEFSRQNETRTNIVVQGTNAGSTPEKHFFDGRWVVPVPMESDGSSSDDPCGGVFFNETSQLEVTHGTGVAGLVGGHTVGVAPGVTIVAVTAVGCRGGDWQPNTAGLIGALDWVRQDIAAHPGRLAVVSMSTFRFTEPLGVTNRCGISDQNCIVLPDLDVLEDIIGDIVDDGVPVVASANNYAQDACGMTPSRLSFRGGLGKVISVGGTGLANNVTNAADSRWGLSDYGQCVDIWAPAEDIAVPYRNSANGAVYRTEYASGTSWSAPIVAGLVARILAEDRTTFLEDEERNPETATLIMERLRANATRFMGPTLDTGTASPSILAHLGAATFKETPRQRVVATAGSTITLDANVVDESNFTYQWYRRPPPGGAVQTIAGANSATLTFSASDPHVPATGMEYWVQVTDTSAPGRWVRTERTLVTIGTSLEIVSDPASAWVTTGSVQLSSMVKAGGSFRYLWQRSGPALQSNWLPAWDSAPDPSTVVNPVLNMPMPVSHSVEGDGVSIFRLGLRPMGCTSDDCTVYSDTARIDFCQVPANATFDVIGAGSPFDPQTDYEIDLAYGNSKIRFQSRPLVAGERLSWLYHDVSINQMRPVFVGIADGGRYIDRYETSRDLYPPKPGLYALQIGNRCGSAVTSVQARVKSVCTFRALGRRGAGAFSDGALINGERVLNLDVVGGDTLEISAETASTNNIHQYPPPQYSYRWSTGGTGTTYTVPSVDPPTSVTVTVTDGLSGCVRTLVFKLNKRECASSTPSFVVLSRQCGSVSRQFDHYAYLDGDVVIDPYLYDSQSGAALDPDTFELEWVVTRTGGVLQRPSGRQLRIPYVVVDGGVSRRVESVVLYARRNGECNSLSATVVPIERNCADGPGCIKYCKVRSVRHNGVFATAVTVTSGEPGFLGPPEEQPGWSYEWHTETATSTDHVFSNVSQPAIAPTTDGTYWVITRTSATEEDRSDDLHIAVTAEGSTGPEGRATPQVQTIDVGTNAIITASVSGGIDLTGATYQWRRGPNFDSSQPVIHNGPTLNVTTPPDDVSFWCLITHNGNVYETNMATVVVNCTPFDGGIVVTPVGGHVARGQRPKLSAVATGKLVFYSWYRRVPPENAIGPVAYGPALMPSVSDAVSYFSAVAEDSCGNTAALPERAIYLCKPSIGAQPAPHTIVAPSPTTHLGTTTLSVAAAPAIDGQPLTVTWYRSGYNNGNGPPVVGQGLTFTPSVAEGTSETYYATVSAPCADGEDAKVYSEGATVEVCAPPVITGHSPNRNITDGATTTVVVVAMGEELTYQWYKGNSGDTSAPLNGWTDNSHEVTPTPTTSYWCRVKSKGVCTTDSETITVNLCWPPAITAQPQGRFVFSGGTAALSVGINAGFNTQTPVYQWQQLVNASLDSWSNISGATAAAFTTPALTVGTTYRVVITIGACQATSNPATVDVCTYPAVVDANPAETRTTVGQQVHLHLILSPVFDRIIRWYEGESGDTALFAGGGSINSSLTVSPASTKKYWAQIEYEGCTSRTTNYSVRVCMPTITAQPTGSSIAAGASATLTVGTTNLAGQTFQWYTGTPGTTTSPVPGATAPSLTVTPSATTSYWARVTGTCDGSADSAAASVTVCVPPAISSFSGPVVAIRSGQSTSLSVGASGTDRTYKWYVGQPGDISQPIANSNASSITVSPSETTAYWVRVTSMSLCSTDTSRSVTVDVCALPVFSVYPQSQPSFSGKPLTLTAAASSSTGAVTYQWYQGLSGVTTAPIPGATSSSVTVSPASETNYWVRAKTSVCETDSTTATISMCIYPELVTPSPAEKQSEWGASTTLALPAISPVADKYVTWYRGPSGNTSTVVDAGLNKTSFNTPALTATTEYWAQFANGGCTSRTTTYTVRVCKPTITAQPAGAAIQSGQSHTLTVGTTAIPGQTLQWYTGSPGTTTSPVSGGTTASITVTPAATTTYWVRVTGTCGTPVDSAAATMSVCNPPGISSVTSARFIQSGSSTSISTNGTGTSLTYQWYIGASGTTTSPVANSNSSSINVSPAVTTSYWAKITSNGLCVTNGPAIVVDVCTTPVITTPPQSQTIRIGQPATLTVATSASGATYQWYQGAPGTTTTPLGTTASINVTPTADTQYWVRITRGACDADSAGATVTVCQLTASVANVNAASGQNATLTAAVTQARGSLTHWWYRGSVSDTSTLLFAGNYPQITVSRTSTTSYWVRVTDGTCTVDSNTATLDICVPAIATQPQNVVVPSGQTTTLSVAATGSPLTYHWYIGDSGVTTSPIAGATAASYTTPAVTATTKYWVRVSGCSAVNSATATVSPCQPPGAPSAPATAGLYPGNAGSVSINATGTGLTYQWYKGQSGVTTQPISGATNATYTFIIAASEYYWVRVTGTCGSVNSAAVFHNVMPAITTQPQNAGVPSGTSATLSVAASGNYLTYQWYLGPYATSPISGATSATYVTAPITSPKTYWVKVTSGTASVNSTQIVASPCEGPIVNFTATPQGSHSWKLQVTIYSEGDLGNVDYEWYIGTPGNVAQSTSLGLNSYYRYVNNLTQSQTWWVRVWRVDRSCYTDTPGATIY